MRFAILTAAVTATLALANATQANTTYSFGGIVESTSPFLGDRFTIGMPISGEFTFDPATPDVLGGDPSRGNFLGAIESMSVTIGDYVATSLLAGDIAVLDSDEISPLPRPHRDAYTVVSVLDGNPINGHALFLGSLQILDFDGDALTNDLIDPPALDAFSDPLITIDFAPVGSTQNRVWGRLTNLERVPEPSGLLMVIAGVLAVARRRQRRC